VVFLESGRLARVFFTVEEHDGDTPRYLVTEITFDREGRGGAGGGGLLDEVGIERLSQTVYLSAMGFWAGNLESSPEQMEADPHPQPHASPASSSSPPPLSPQSRAEAPSSPAKTSHVGLRIGPEYAVRWRGDQGAVHALGGSLGVYQHSGIYELGGDLRVQSL